MARSKAKKKDEVIPFKEPPEQKGYLGGVVLDASKGEYDAPFRRTFIATPFARLNDYMNERGRALTRAERLGIMLAGVSFTMGVLRLNAIVRAVLDDELDDIGRHV